MVRNKHNTPGIIKYPFWQMAYERENMEYICINAKEAYVPEEIRDRSICINADIGEILKQFIGSNQVNRVIRIDPIDSI